MFPSCDKEEFGDAKFELLVFFDLVFGDVVVIVVCFGVVSSPFLFGFPFGMLVLEFDPLLVVLLLDRDRLALLSDFSFGVLAL